MPEVDRLCPLKVGVGGGGPVAVGLCLRDQRLHQRLEQRDRPGGVRPNQQGQVGRHLIVPGARRVELAASRADQLGESPLDRHVDVLVLLAELERALVQLPPDPVESPRDLLELSVIEHTELGEHPGVRLRLLDVERGQAPVERDR
jgi:hypothetical protein